MGVLSLEINLKLSKWREQGVKGRIGLIIQNIGVLGFFGSLIHNSLNLNFVSFSSVLPYVFFILGIVGTIVVFCFDKKREIDVKPLKRPID